MNPTYILPSKKIGVTGFSIHEAGEKIRRLGILNGYEAVAEFPVYVENRQYALRIDWVWLYKGLPIAGFEVEGKNVGKSSLIMDRLKLKSLQISHVFIITYNCRYTQNGWRELKLCAKHLENFQLQNNPIAVFDAGDLESTNIIQHRR